MRVGSSARWGAVALAVIAGGTTVSLLAARDTAADQAASERSAFERSALETSGALQAAIEHQQDLGISTAAVVARNPDISSTELTTWLESIDAAERYPELTAVAVMRVVPAEQLDEFVQRLRDDPGSLMGPDRELQITPPGPRDSYCLLQAVVSPDPDQLLDLDEGLDNCATPVAPVINAARDSANSSHLAMTQGGDSQLVVQTPIYAGGLDPGTVELRRQRFIGMLGTAVQTDVMFANVLRERSELSLSLIYEGPTSSATFSSGEIDGEVESVQRTFGSGWYITISRAMPDVDWWESANAIRLLVTGSLASVLLGGMLFVLGTSRRRALRLVERRTDQLNHQALHDALTDLPNRTLILDRAEQLLARCRRDGTRGAALYVDLDGFKDVNDTLGHEAGDQLLRSVATRLTTSLRGVDTVGRLGGDEFVVLVDQGAMHTGPELVAERLLEVLRQPFDLDLAPRPIVVTASVGIAFGDQATAGDLLRDADIALYRAKAAGRNRYETFRPEMEEEVQRQFELEADLRNALAGDQFELFYQPIYDLSDLSLVGAEALLRWHHPEKGTIDPARFIPRLEATGGIVEVGRWVLFQACRQARQWQDAGHQLGVSVNVSARQLEHDAIVDHVRDALSTSGADPRRITIEITETELMRDTEFTASRLGELKALGVKLAIDDFGTGYSSLAYLQRFPVDCLKIDRSFTNAIAHTPESDALIHTLVQLGKSLGLTTVAEGVETTGQLDYLRDVDVDIAQGFLLARPLTATEFGERMLPVPPPARSQTPT